MEKTVIDELNSSEEPLAKKPAFENMNNQNDIADGLIKIGTHNGTFHCDEVLACFMLKQLPKYKNAAIVRTRDPLQLNECHIVVDVGAIYDLAKHRFDHHQRSFNETMNSIQPEKKWLTKLSSAGLIYCHFGEEILHNMMKDVDEAVLQVIYDMVYENFVEEIDAIDNGIDQFDGKARYKITTNLSARVSRLNPDWNDEEGNETEQFYKAMDLVGKEFTDKVQGYFKNWLPARDIVQKALKSRSEVDDSKQILKLEKFCPWKEHLFRLEEEKELVEQIIYILFQDKSGKWRIQCVPSGRNTFENRLSLPSKWRGVRDSELSELSGIPGCIFVHASGFIGGNESYEGALAMARYSLKHAEK